MLDERRAILVDMVAEADRSSCRQVVEQEAQGLLAIRQRRRPQVLAVAGRADRRRSRRSVRRFRPSAPAAAPRSSTRRSRPRPRSRRRSGRRARPRPSRAVTTGLNLSDPVEALAGQELDLAAVDAGLHAIAVELDLVQPCANRSARHPRARPGPARRRAEGCRPSPARSVPGSGSFDRAPWPPGALRMVDAHVALRRQAPRSCGPTSGKSSPLRECRDRPAARAASSSALSRSHSSFVATRPAAVRTRCHRPLRRSPSSVKVEPAAGVIGCGITVRDPAAAIPDDHGAAAVLARRDHTFEVEVLRMG